MSPSATKVSFGPSRDVQSGVRVIAATLFLAYFGFGLRTLGEVGPVPLWFPILGFLTTAAIFAHALFDLLGSETFDISPETLVVTDRLGPLAYSRAFVAAHIDSIEVVTHAFHYKSRPYVRRRLELKYKGAKKHSLRHLTEFEALALRAAVHGVYSSASRRAEQREK